MKEASFENGSNETYLNCNPWNFNIYKAANVRTALVPISYSKGTWLFRKTGGTKKNGENKEFVQNQTGEWMEKVGRGGEVVVVVVYI